MKIATLNIDWANKQKSKNHYIKIEKFLNKENFDFLILTEAIHLSLKNFGYKYFSEKIPENIKYDNLNYSEFLNGEKAYRTILYSKSASVKKYPVIDDKTSIALEFKTQFGNIVFYSTIIGTWFNKQPFANRELENCISDCEEIFKTNRNIFLVGDLNTSFLDNEKKFTINSETTSKLKNLFHKLNLYNATKEIKENIDHIIIPKTLKNKVSKSLIFVEKDVLSDHQGIYIELK